MWTIWRVRRQCNKRLHHRPLLGDRLEAGRFCVGVSRIENLPKICANPIYDSIKWTRRRQKGNVFSNTFFHWTTLIPFTESKYSIYLTLLLDSFSTGKQGKSVMLTREEVTLAEMENENASCEDYHTKSHTPRIEQVEAKAKKRKKINCCLLSCIRTEKVHNL